MKKQAIQLSCLVATISLLAGCQPIAGWNNKPVVDVRMQHYDSVVIVNEFESCLDEAREREELATERRDTSGYLVAARLFERCVNVHQSDLYAAPESRFKAAAAAAVNYLKGGSVDGSVRMVGLMEQDYPDQDLIFSDGSSFKDSVRALQLGAGFSQTDALRLHARPRLETELVRIATWSRQ